MIEVVPGTRVDIALKAAASNGAEPAKDHNGKHSEVGGDGHSRVHACVQVPLKIGNDILGVMALQRKSRGIVDLNDIHLVQAPAVRASEDAACVMAAEEHAGLLKQPRKSGNHPDDLTSKYSNLPAADARRRLCGDLANEAMRVSKAYRTAVRLVDLGGKALGAEAIAPVGSDLWPPDFAKAPLSLHEDSAATYAFNRGESFFIEDKGLGAKARSWPISQSGVHHLDTIRDFHSSTVRRQFWNS